MVAAKGDMALGNKLRELRMKKKLASKDLAGKIGMSPAYYSKIEKGHVKLTDNFLDKLAEALGVSKASILRAAKQNGKTDEGATSTRGAKKADAPASAAKRARRGASKKTEAEAAHGAEHVEHETTPPTDHEPAAHAAETHEAETHAAETHEAETHAAETHAHEGRTAPKTTRGRAARTHKADDRSTETHETKGRSASRSGRTRTAATSAHSAATHAHAESTHSAATHAHAESAHAAATHAHAAATHAHAESAHAAATHAHAAATHAHAESTHATPQTVSAGVEIETVPYSRIRDRARREGPHMTTDQKKEIAEILRRAIKDIEA